MADFHVYMVGLISHIGEDDDTAGRFKKHAAILREPLHHTAPRICIRGADLHTPAPDVRCLLLEDDEITFSLPGAVAETDRLFQDTIPSLNVITDGGQLNNGVKGRGKHTHVLGYIVYPAGRLTVARMYRKTGRYVLLGTAIDTPHCIGAITDFWAATDDPFVRVTVTDVSDRKNPSVRATFDVRSDRKICIMHDSDHDPVGQHHLDHHRRLTNAPQIARVVNSNNDCPVAGLTPNCACQNPHHDGSESPDLGDPECSNTQWP